MNPSTRRRRSAGALAAIATLTAIGMVALVTATSPPASAVAPAQAQQRLLPVPAVDLQRYAGTWYELARLPNRFQDQCLGDVTATYALRDDGNVAVTNRCRTAEGEGDGEGDATWEVAEGAARPVDETNARLKVSFLPAWLRWLPVGWGDYWVLELDPQYRHVLVGEPSRRYLWVLARSPAMPTEQLQDILGRAREMGFPTESVVVTPHR
jgi:apolipoprotein D and lipocalin family protein